MIPNQFKSPSEYTLLAASMIFTALLLWQSPIKTYQYGDSMGSLLVSQQLLKTGSPVIDNSEEEIRASGYTWQMRQSKGNMLYAYPLGTSYLSVPAVAVANILGYDMENIHDQAATQKVLAIISLLISILLLHCLARRFIPPKTSIILVLIFTLGTTLSSSVSLAYWNFNLEIIFITGSILLLVKAGDWKNKKPATLLGILLFAAFFCRPTAAPFIATTLLFLAIYNRRHFYTTALASGILFVAHTAFAFHYYGSLTPGQHHIASLKLGSQLLEGIMGTTISPSKGIFINSPILIFAIITPFFLHFKKALKPLDLFICGGILLHLLTISAWGMWWGGGSFASRLCTDALPAYFYLLVRFLQASELTCVVSASKQPIILGCIVVTSIFSIFVHTVQGTFNPWTERFNNDPLIGSMETKQFFDWRFPQFLSSEKMLRERHEYYFSQKAASLLKGLKDSTNQRISFGQDMDKSQIHIQSGFHAMEETGRWLSGTESTFYLRIPKEQQKDYFQLEFEANYFGPSEAVTLLVDSNKIGSFDLLNTKKIFFDKRILDSSKDIHQFKILTTKGTSPLKAGLSQDSRNLKLWLSSISLTYSQSPN